MEGLQVLVSAGAPGPVPRPRAPSLHRQGCGLTALCCLHTGRPWGKRTTGDPRRAGPERRPGESLFLKLGPHPLGAETGARPGSGHQNHRTRH